MLRLGVVLLLVFLAAPSFFIVPVSFTTDAFIEWPPKWGSLKWYVAILEHPTWITAITRSLIVGFLTAVLAMGLGAPAAFLFVIAAREFAQPDAARHNGTRHGKLHAEFGFQARLRTAVAQYGGVATAGRNGDGFHIFSQH